MPSIVWLVPIHKADGHRLGNKKLIFFGINNQIHGQWSKSNGHIKTVNGIRCVRVSLRAGVSASASASARV